MKTFTITIDADDTFDADIFCEALARDIIYLMEQGEIEGVLSYTIGEN